MGKISLKARNTLQAKLYDLNSEVTHVCQKLWSHASLLLRIFDLLKGLKSGDFSVEFVLTIKGSVKM